LKPTHLPANLKTIRRRCALNQEQLADLLGLQSKGNPAAVISNWERGLNQPGLDYLLRLQDLTQLDLTRLLRSALTLEDLPGRPKGRRRAWKSRPSPTATCTTTAASSPASAN